MELLKRIRDFVGGAVGLVILAILAAAALAYAVYVIGSFAYGFAALFHGLALLFDGLAWACTHPVSFLVDVSKAILLPLGRLAIVLAVLILVLLACARLFALGRASGISVVRVVVKRHRSTTR